MTIRNQRSFAAGCLFIVIGIFGAAVAGGYRLGSAARMGPGYFPLLVSLLMAVLGAVIAARSLGGSAPREALEDWDLRRLATIVGSVVLFGLLLRPLGFQVAMLAMLLAACTASREMTWKGAVVTSVVLAVVCTIVFVWALGVRMPSSAALWSALEAVGTSSG
jgi:hypothetical protein